MRKRIRKYYRVGVKRMLSNCGQDVCGSCLPKYNPEVEPFSAALDRCPPGPAIPYAGLERACQPHRSGLTVALKGNVPIFGTSEIAMHIITRSRLVQFGRAHAEAASELRDWARIVRRRQYRTPLEVKADFPTASFVGPWKTVFNIHRNDYRLVVDVRYDLGRVYVRHIVTHRECDRLNEKGLL